MRRDVDSGAEVLPENDNAPAPAAVESQIAKSVERFRRATLFLVLASSVMAAALALMMNVRVDPSGTALLNLFAASLLLFSRIWWRRSGHIRVADACGTVALVSLMGMSCGALSMLGLRLHFPLADRWFWSLDHLLGLDAISIAEQLISQGQWIFSIMAPAYAQTIPLLILSMCCLALLGRRLEAWRACFCFAGALFTICLIALFLPAKGLGTWAPDALLARLPAHSMLYFWPAFDSFYSGPAPVLSVATIDGVISFPSFHAVMGFIVAAMWRNKLATLLPALLWLAFMLLATIPYGGHYVVDLIGGLAVWSAWFAASFIVQRGGWRQQRPAVALVAGERFDTRS